MIKGRNAIAGCYFVLFLFKRLLDPVLRGIASFFRWAGRRLKYRKEISLYVESLHNVDMDEIEVPKKSSNKKAKKFKKKEVEECPEFAEIHELGNNLVLGIEKLTRTPDEVALVRVLSEETFSKQYKKKVYTTKRGIPRKYIKVDGKKIFLKKEKVYLD